MLTSLWARLRGRSGTTASEPAELAPPDYRSLEEQILWTDLMAIEAAGQLYHAIHTMGRAPLVLDPEGPPASRGQLVSGTIAAGHYMAVPLTQLSCDVRINDLTAVLYTGDRLSLVRNLLTSPLVSMKQAIRTVLHPYLERLGTIVIATRPFEEPTAGPGARDQVHTSHVLRQQLHFSVTSRREPETSYVTFRLRLLFGIARLLSDPAREGSD